MAVFKAPMPLMPLPNEKYDAVRDEKALQALVELRRKMENYLAYMATFTEQQILDADGNI